MIALRKLGIGLSFVITVVTLGILISPARALALTGADFDNATYVIVSDQRIDVIIGNRTIQFIDGNPLDNDNIGKANYKPAGTDINANFCSNTIGGGGDAEKGITLLPNFDDLSNGIIKAGINIDLKAPDGSCQNYTSGIEFSKQSDGSFKADGTGIGGEGEGEEIKDNSCEAKADGVAGAALSWIVCPILGVVDSVVNQMNNVIEGALVFNTENNLNGETKQAWSTVSRIAIALIVIAMLLMIISTALGGGPFDAYTVRKLLPRLLIAVIAIQISWELVKWLNELANHAGEGLAAILAKPFGGEENLKLASIMADLGAFSAAGMMAGLSFIALIGTGAVLALNAPLLLMLGFSALIAIFTGFVVLILREALIVLLAVLVPLAIACWVLPGLQKYWKLWSDNFSKLLLMFPLIVGILFAGRIFAHIAAGSKLGGGDTITFIIVLVAFFGPYFLIIKTFRMGGAMMGALSGAVQTGIQKTAAPGRSTLERMKARSTWSQGRKARNAELDHRAGARFAGGLNAGGFRQFTHRTSLAGIGRPGRRGEAGLRQHIAQTAEERLRNEEINTESLALDRQIAEMPRGRGDATTAGTKIHTLLGELSNPNSNEHRRQAALQKLAQLKAGDALTAARDQLLASGHAGEWNRAVGNYYADFQQTSPHLTGQLDLASGYADAAHPGRTRDQFDASSFGNADDPTLAAMSGEGWQRYQAVNPVVATEVYHRIMTSGLTYAGSVKPDVHAMFGGRPVAPPAVPPRPGVPAPASPAEQWFADASDFEIGNLATRVGGYSGLSDDDLMHVYNHRTGDLRAGAETELRNRGLIQ